MNGEKSSPNIPDAPEEKITPESWVGVYRILALVAVGFVGYGTIKYATDSQFSTSVDKLIQKIGTSYTIIWLA